MSFVVPSSQSAGRVLLPNGNVPPLSASDFAKTVGRAAAARYGPTILDAAINRADSTVGNLADRLAGNSGSTSSKTRTKTSTNSPKGNGNNNNNSGGSARGGRRSRKGPQSAGVGGSVDVSGIPQITIDTGIDSGIIVNPLQGTTDYYSPVYIQCGRFFESIVDSDSSFFSELINSELYFKYKIIVNAVITNSFSRYFTEANFYNYIAKVSYALQLYYMVDSILAYTTNSPNNNIGMWYLRMGITPDIANGHLKLKEYLETIPIPPNLLEYIRYMYQNFSFNNVSGAPIIRLSLDDSLCTSEYAGNLGINATTYTSLFSNLISLNETASIIAKIRSNWVTPMPASSYESLFDPQFSTFWHNSNICYEEYDSNSVSYTINASSNNELIYYGIFDNRLDGIIYASVSVNDENNIMQQGMWQPFRAFGNKDTINSSLLYYARGDSIRPIHDREYRDASMVHAAPFVNVMEDDSLQWEVTRMHSVASCIPQVHTLENTTQAVVKSVLWLLEP